MLYERKITYLDYTVRGERCGVGGFIKTERRDEVCNITLQINAHEDSASYVAKVNIIGEQEKEFCNLELIGGRAVRHFREVNISDIGGTGISYDEMVGIRVLLPSEREICGKIKDKQKGTGGQVRLPIEEITKEQNKENTIVAEVHVHEEAEPILAETSVHKEREAVVVEQKENDESKEAVAEVTEQQENDTLAAEVFQYNESQAEEKQIWEVTRCEEKPPKSLWIQDDKWHQLWEIYPHISPFQDEREYLSIGPNDFVILPKKYFQMANNSFLLHGYHNYRHLVLKKMNHHGEEKYYIGVPGNFYDREKQVAVMFGFEGFESLKEPASPGDYGYYMMRIEL